MTTASVAAWAEAYRQAWEHADAAAAAALFAEGSSYRSNIFEEPHTGRDGIAAYWADVTESQADPTVLMGRPFVDGSRAAVEFWTTMRVDGDDTTLTGCLLLTFDEEGLCTDLREYWHFTSGILQPPASWGSLGEEFDPPEDQSPRSRGGTAGTRHASAPRRTPPETPTGWDR